MKTNKTTLLTGAVLLVAALCLSTATAWAQLSSGTIDLATVPGGNLTYDDWTFDNTTNVYTILNNANVTVINSNGTSQRRLAVAEGATADITLSGVTIEGLTNNQSPLLLNSGADVTLFLADDTTSTLKAGYGSAGIQAPDGTRLTIEGTTGILYATGGGAAAGIGGGTTASGGTITINGGTVTATGTAQGAGIGGGVTASGGTITISGGTVTAQGGGEGAGIGGGGNGGSGGTITISGGTVTATGTSYGAGIGGGAAGSGGTITISGGTVKATKGTSSNRADIGPGASGSGGTVTITGGSVNCTSADKIVGTLTNGAGTDVYLTTLTLGTLGAAHPITEGYISGVACAATPNAATGVYGIKDVTTDDAGKVYFYLPASGSGGTEQERVRLTADGVHYGKGFARTNAGTAEILPALTLTPVAFTAAEQGGNSGDVSSTGVVLTFSGIVTTPDNYVTFLPANATAGTPATSSGSGDTWTVPLTAVAAQGSAQVRVEDFGGFWIDNNPQTVLLYKDTQEPTVTSVSPDGATGVLVPITTNTLSVTFSEAMNTGVGTVTLSPAGALLGISPSWTGNTATYNLSGLAYGTTYTYDISGFKDVGGNEMVAVTAASSPPFTFSTPTLQTITDATYSTAEPCVGNAITATAGTYDAHDGGAAGTHTYQWYRANDNLGTGETLIVSTTTLTTYTPVSDDFGKYICIETTPVGSNGYPGVPVKSPWIQVGVRLRAGTVGGTQTPTTGITVAGVDSTVVYSASAVAVALSAPYPSDIVAWSALPAVGSFDNDASAITTYAPPASPSGNITLSATLDKGAAPDITFPTTGSTITYGDDLSTSSLSSGGTAGRGSFAWQTPATLPTVANSGYAVEFTPTPSDLDQYDYSLVTDWNGSKVVRTVGITVNPLPVTVSITAATKEYDGTTAATLNDTTLTGKLDADNLYLTSGTITFDNKDVGTGKTVTFSGYALGGADAGNYTLANSSVTDTASITAATLTVTPHAGQSKVVGTPDPAAYTYDTDGWKGSDGASLLSGALDRATGENVGAYAITQGTLADTSGNYTINFTAGVTFEITPVTSDNTKVSTVAVNGVTLPTGAPNFYLADCGTASAQITITPQDSTSQVIYEGTAGSTFSIDIARADIHEVTYTVQSTDGSEQTHTLQIESRFAFAAITGMKFNNVLYVNNNTADNGGYEFTHYEWYRNGQPIGNEQVYSAGDNRTDRLDPTADYSAVVTTVEGKTLQVCPSKVTIETTSLLKAYPNPVPQGATVTIESTAADGSLIRLYNITGGLVNNTKQLHNNKAQLTAPQATGIYVITVDGEMAKVVVE
ncbi:hypothetical protein AGMMS4956_10030 [Bacteroidia bacterium]|nr:hypothetical protein AGMMS4956_10030 [Bacteroidia bacterium]